MKTSIARFFDSLLEKLILKRHAVFVATGWASPPRRAAENSAVAWGTDNTHWRTGSRGTA